MKNITQNCWNTSLNYGKYYLSKKKITTLIYETILLVENMA